MAGRETVLLIHGTGAGEEGAVGSEKWWQPSGLFARSLGAALRREQAGKTIELVAFKWSGANSEYARRQGGIELSHRLDEYEQQGTDYHLIGHSHGGSVIWHALLHSAKQGKRRDHLHSWITVGTPFLHFVPRSRTFVVVVCALLLCAVALMSSFWPVVGDVMRDLRTLIADAPLWALFLIFLAPAILIATIVWLVLALFAHAKTVQREAMSSAAEQTLRTFGTRYIPLWHPLDEPISGLSASLSSPPEIAPRAPVEDSRRLRSLPSHLYNRTAASLMDALVWWVITGRLQGRDVRGLVLESCGPLPPKVIDRQNSLSLELQQQIASQADSLASQSAVRLRLALNEIGARRKPLASLAQAISWQEVVHTSYFDHARFAEVCSELILHQATTTGAKSGLDEPRHDAAVPASVPLAAGRDVRPLNYFEPRGLYVLSGVVALGALLLVTSASRSAWQALGLPLTSRFQIDTIAANARKPEFTRLWDSPAVGDIAVRLVAMDRLDDPLRLLRVIDNPNTLIRAAQRISYAYGFLDRQGALEPLIDYVIKGKFVSGDEDISFYMKAFAFAGALDANGARAEKLAADLVSHIERESLVLFGNNSNAGLWFSHLLKTAQGPRLIELAAKWDCDQIKQVIESPSMRDHAVRVEPLWARCDAKQGLPQEPQQVDSTRRSEEELVASFSKRDPKDTADLNRLEVAEEIAVLVRHGDQQKAVAFLKDIGDQRREDLLEELGTNTLGSIVVHIKSRNEHAELGRRIVAAVEEVWVSKIHDQSLYGLGMATVQAGGLVESMRAMQELGSLPRLAARFEPAGDQKNPGVSAFLWLAAGDPGRASEQFRAALAEVAGEQAFADAMAIALRAVPFDRPLAREAVDVAMRVLGQALSIDSLPVYGYSVDDSVAVLARTGAFRRARELAESVGRPLSTPVVPKGDSQPPEFEKLALQGDGVLGSYARILDAWIEQTGTEEARSFVRRQREWPPTFEMARQSINRG